MFKFKALTPLLAFALLIPACGESDDGSGDTANQSGTTSSTGTTGSDETMAGDDTGTDSNNMDESTTTDPTDGTTTMNTFVPDGGGASCGEECDIWNPDDCPDGEKCTSVACEVGSNAWDSNVCREVQGTAATGDECMYTDGSGVSGNDTCGAGSMCWNADADTGLGVCIAFCSGSPDAPTCPAASTCSITNNGTLPLCLPSCDPLAQDCEASNELCIPNPDGTGYICTLDASGQMAPYGTPCNYINVCNTGLLCIDGAGVPEPECASAAGCCSPMCSISGGDACPGQGQTCEPIFDPQPPGFEDVGVCTIAM
jgi:hypothetical protein